MSGQEITNAMPEVKGIDISHHQNEIDWEAATSDGIMFAFAKATDGANVVDKRFAENWPKCERLGCIAVPTTSFGRRSLPRTKLRRFLGEMAAEGRT